MNGAGPGADPPRRIGDPEAVARVFDAMPIMLVGTEGRDSVFVAVNRAYQDQWGDRQLVGLPTREAVPELAGQQMLELPERVYATGVAETAREWRVEVPLPEGGSQERFLDFTASPRRDADGVVVGVNVYAVEVTDRVRERQAAQERAARAESRVAAARDVIDALQRELLPAGVPVVPGLEIAASYLLADADAAAGGDWFDAVTLPDGRVALVVGDVVGHGVAASAVMGQLRVLLWDRLTETGDVRLALEAADRFAERVRGARAATVVVAVVDPADGTMSYCTAGHPPPLVVPASGSPRYLPVTGRGPLGTEDVRMSIGHDTLGPGDVVLLYTDGVLERPGRELAGASVELAQVAADVAAGRALRTSDPTVVERVTTQSLELLTRGSGHTDDITLLAAQRVRPPADLMLHWATATEPLLAEFHAALAGWLEALHVGDDDALVVAQALGELVTNAVEHAYRDHPTDHGDPGARPGAQAGVRAGSVAVTATVTRDGELRAEVRDEGRWHQPSPPTGNPSRRGRGLWMVSELVDQLAVEHPGGATVASIIHRLSRPARLLTAETVTTYTGPARAGSGRYSHAPLVIDDRRAGRLGVAGPIDSTTASHVGAALAGASAGGTHDLVVDLTGVTHLASAGVSVLHDADLRSLANGAVLQLHAPTGSPADQILTLVALPHTTTQDTAGPATSEPGSDPDAPDRPGDDGT